MSRSGGATPGGTGSGSGGRPRPCPEVLALESSLVADRRDLHRHPELAYEETRTAAKVAERMAGLGFDVRTGVGRTGVVATLRRGRSSAAVLWRADMDALPIQEPPSTPHASERPGVMHACGHDAHVAIGLGLARLLAESSPEWTGTVRFAFQPAEEGDGGAQSMLDDGLLDDVDLDAAFALHVDSRLEVGRAGVPSGVAFAGCRDFEVWIEGQGGHGSMPHETRDVVACGAHVVTALHAVLPRRVDALQPAVVTVGAFQAGTKASVIPERARLAGTLRAHDRGVLTLLADETERVVSGVAAAHGCRVEVRMDREYLPVVNDPGWSDRVRAVARRLLGEAAVGTQLMGGAEDMGDVFARVPGCYFTVGAGNARRGIGQPHHSPGFGLDEACLLVGVELAWRVVLDALAVDATKGSREASARGE